MKKLRLPLLAALLLGFVASVHAAGSSAKTKTYAVLGFFDGAKPAQALVDQAAKEIGTQMTGAVQVDNLEEADHVVQVVFRRGGYKIYVDALPYSNVASYPVTRRDGLEHAAARALAESDNRFIDSQGRGK